MEDIKVYNYGLLGLEVYKNNNRYQAVVPGGVPLEEAAEAMDYFRLTLLELKKRADQIAQAKKEGEDAPVGEQVDQISEPAQPSQEL